MLENTDQLASMLWGMLKTRLALASLELNEARHRFVRLLLLSVFTVISGLLCLITLTVFLGVFLQKFFLLENVLLGLMLFYLILAILGFIGLRLFFNRRLDFFAATRAELAKDCEVIWEAKR